MSPPQVGHASGNSSPTRAISFAQAFARGVVRAGLCMSVAAAFHGMSADSPAGGLPAGGGVAPLANIPDRQLRDGFPQPVIRREYSVIAMPVLPRRRHEIGEPVEELKRPELDDAIGPRSRGRSPAAGADPVGGFMPWKRVAHARDSAARVADHGESLQGEGRPGAISQQVLERLKIDTQLGRQSAIRARASMENPLFSQASMAAAAEPSSR